MKRISSILFLITACFATSAARDFSDDTEVFFRQSHTDVDLNYRDNRQTVDSLVSNLSRLSASDSLFNLKKLVFIGTASPEGTVAYNDYLSQRRAEDFRQYLVNRLPALSDIDYQYSDVGRDWVGLLGEVSKDSNVPARQEVISYLYGVLNKLSGDQPDGPANLEGLKEIDGGRAYKYMYSALFPNIRSAIVFLEYSYRPYERLTAAALPDYSLSTEYALPEPSILPVSLPARREHNFYMALKTNMLYDALALPNIGAEFYLGKNFSVVGNWTYGWWDTDRRHRYWRAYGGDVALRWWFGSKAEAKPLTGHHVGVYGGAFTYDFEFGGRGYMGGKPDHSLWDKCLLNCGIEYGYSLPVSRRLDIDFTIGIGYISGQYYEYTPQDGHYVWQSTHNLNWFGPTKAEISLVWLIGHGNFNAGKGGQR